MAKEWDGYKQLQLCSQHHAIISRSSQWRVEVEAHLVVCANTPPTNTLSLQNQLKTNVLTMLAMKTMLAGSCIA